MQTFKLTTPQQNIWNLHQYYAGTAIANQCGAVIFDHPIDVDILRNAVRTVIREQSALRLRLVRNEVPEQYISEDDAPQIPAMTFADDKELDAYAERVAGEPVTAYDAPLYRFTVFRFQDGRSGVVAVLSHLIADAWSFALIVREIDAICHYRTGDTATDAFCTADYTAFVRSEAAYLASDRYQRDRKYWEARYTARPELSPIKPEAGTKETVEARRIQRRLDRALSTDIDTFCEKHRTTPAVLFETVMLLYLARINREHKTVTIGVPVLNRADREEKRTIGMFISTVPLTVDIRGDMTVRELLDAVTGTHREIFRHQRYPYAEILRGLRERQDFSGNLYDVMVSVQNAETSADAMTRWYFSGFSELPLTLHVDDRDNTGRRTLTVDYQTAVFPQAGEIDLLIARLEYILEQMIDNPVFSVQEIRILPDAERELLVERFNDTHMDYPREKCVHELFEEQVKRTPENIAVVFDNDYLTYRELNDRANHVARILKRLGVVPNSYVAICARRSAEMVTAIYAVWKSGGAYVPIAPDYPNERIRYILEDCRPICIVTAYAKLSFEISLPIIDLADVRTDSNLSENLENVNRSSDAAYCIYTSGTTGKPKGVVNSHRGLLNRVIWMQTKYPLYENDAILQKTTYTFDVSVWEFVWWGLSGGKVVMLKPGGEKEPKEIIRAIADNRVTVIHFVPSMLNIFLQYMHDIQRDVEKINSLKYVFTSGEALAVDTLRKFDSIIIKRFPSIHIANLYGPTESSIDVTYYDCMGTEENIPIGKPISNIQIYILDEDELCGVGIVGELCIAGDGVSKGYLNKPELTAERFVPNPFATENNHHGKIMYRTGDLARWRSDGEIEYLGRIDTQVKIRGLRIELGEIESVMAAFSGIGLAAAAAQKDENGRQYLVGYYTAPENLDKKELRAHLAAKLPKYMVPNYFVRLDEMPMTPSGKTDRKSLPLPNFTIKKNDDYVAPETDIEQRLAEIWQNLLRADRIGRNDDFFDLGGDSLFAIAMGSEIEKCFGISLSMENILRHSSLEQMAAQIGEAEKGGAAYPHLQSGNGTRYRLLPQQEAIYAACTKDPASMVYNLPARLPLSTDIDRKKLKEAIHRVIKRHKALNCAIIPSEDGIFAVYNASAEPIFEEYEKSDEHTFFRAFDLTKPPLVHIGFTEGALLLDAHHIAADGATLRILLREIADVYEEKTSAGEALWYADYADHIHAADKSESQKFFRKILSIDAEPVMLPETATGETGGISRFYQIPTGMFQSVKRYAQNNALTETMVFLGAYGMLLSQYSGRHELMSGVILQNRTHPDTRGMVGMFVNTLPVLFRVKSTLTEYFSAIKEMLLGLFRYQDTPLVEVLEDAGITDHSVLNTAFVYQGDGEINVSLGGTVLTPTFVETGTSKFDLTMELTPTGQNCTIRMEYDRAKYAEHLIDSLAAGYLRILKQLSENNADDRCMVGDLSVLSAEEYRRIVEGFNNTYVEYPREKCVHELFAEQAARTPDKVALVFEEKVFTYRQIDRMSDVLACTLREKGVRRNEAVAIIARRDWRVIVAMLAVLKAGGAYMPVSPDYPAERIKTMLEIAECRIALQYT